MPLLQTKASEQSSSLLHLAPAQWPDQEQVGWLPEGLVEDAGGGGGVEPPELPIRATRLSPRAPREASKSVNEEADQLAPLAPGTALAPVKAM